MRAFRPGTLLFLLASVLALGVAWKPMRAAPRFTIQNDPTAQPEAIFESRMAWRPDGVKEIHGSSLALLPGKELLMVYYGGSSESALDVKLYQTRFRKGEWETPIVLLTPQDVGKATHRYTRRVGNSSLYRDAQGRLHLFFVSVGYFGWSCISLNQMTSRDDGHSWSPPRRLLSTPLLNISTLVRSPAVSLDNGGFLLPVYYELTNKFPEAIEFDEHGVMVRKVRLTGQHGTLQACIVPVNENDAIAYSRNRLFETSPCLKFQQTRDGGRTWTAPQDLHLSNLDSPVAAARLSSTLFVMAYNPTFNREILRLAVSPDGLKWKDVDDLDQMNLMRGHGEIEYSYPTMLVDGDTIDLIYTYHRVGIRHFRLNAAWLKERMRD